MRKTFQMTRLLVGVVLLNAVSMPTWAVDGVILIDQNKAMAGNVTPGDTPGFPVTISLPGSYRLGGNLTTPDANTTAIQIGANNVTFDLNGFTISGPGVTGTGIGVEAYTQCGFPGCSGITVTNGTIQGMGGGAIYAGENALIERIRATGNFSGGFFHTIIQVNPNSTVTHCVVSNNQGSGFMEVIGAGGGSTVTNNVVNSNVAGGPCAICVINATVSGNTVWNNQGTDLTFPSVTGINSLGRSTISGNTVIQNTAPGNAVGLRLSFGDGYLGNVLDNAQNVTGGVSLGQNLCSGAPC
jgi:hypothetical protein